MGIRRSNGLWGGGGDGTDRVVVGQEEVGY
jgi:hypothetical protein